METLHLIQVLQTVPTGTRITVKGRRDTEVSCEIPCGDKLPAGWRLCKSQQGTYPGYVRIITGPLD